MPTATASRSAPVTKGPLAPLTVSAVSALFPGAPIDNIRRHLPLVLKALGEFKLTDPGLAVVALATIRAETAGFLPIDEFVSKFNTSGRSHAFDLYDDRHDLGNTGAPDGERFKGRGFVQLTGRANYARIGKTLGLGDKLVTKPELANDPEIAARILACFIDGKRYAIAAALELTNLMEARRQVNGGTHGLDAFSDAFDKGMALFG